MKKRNWIETSATIATAISTVAMAVFTLWLVVLAKANLEKFIENVRLVNDSVKAQNESVKAQTESLKAQIRSVDLQARGISEQVRSINLQSDSLQSQVQSVDLQRQDVLLNYKPVVFIKGTASPASAQDVLDPYNHAFVLTNSGKLPAREVRIGVIQNLIAENQAGGKMRLFNSQSSVEILHRATLFPGSDLQFWVPKFFGNVFKVEKAQFTFSVFFKGDGFKGDAEESMKFIFSPHTNNQWVLVGPDVDLFQKERAEEQGKITEQERRKGKQFLEEELKRYDLEQHPEIRKWLDTLE